VGNRKNQVSLGTLCSARFANYYSNEINNGKIIKECPRDLVEEFSGA